MTRNKPTYMTNQVPNPRITWQALAFVMGAIVTSLGGMQYIAAIDSKSTTADAMQDVRISGLEASSKSVKDLIKEEKRITQIEGTVRYLEMFHVNTIGITNKE